MEKHDRAYSVCKFIRKYVGDIEMYHIITRITYWYAVLQ